MAKFNFDFDFDRWSALARQDPAAFFVERKRVIDKFISSAPAAQTEMLIGLQSRIDCIRVEAGTPSKAMRLLMDMLGEHLDVLQSQLVQLDEESAGLTSAFNDPHR